MDVNAICLVEGISVKFTIIAQKGKKCAKKLAYVK